MKLTEPRAVIIAALIGLIGVGVTAWIMLRSPDSSKAEGGQGGAAEVHGADGKATGGAGGGASVAGKGSAIGGAGGSAIVGPPDKRMDQPNSTTIDASIDAPSGH
jgi:hypothetical protein